MNTTLKHKLLAAALAVGGLLSAHAASAAVVTLTPSSVATTTGNPVSVDIRVTDLFSSQLGGFDLNIAFNPALLNPTGVTFGPLLGDPGLFEAFTGFSFTTPGIVNFAEVSLLDAAALDALQPTSFSIATLSFDAIGTGFNQFALLDTSTLADASGNPLAIPEPGSMLLLGLGIVGLLTTRKRNVSARISHA